MSLSSRDADDGHSAADLKACAAGLVDLLCFVDSEVSAARLSSSGEKLDGVMSAVHQSARG